MKKLFLLITCIFQVTLSSSQNFKGIIGNENWFKNWTTFKPKTVDYNETTNILSGEINKSTTLYKKNTYLLVGIVYLTENAILTIEPGTVIRGDFETCGTLVITKGCKIIAEGTDTDPIVFTSNKSNSDRNPGDWGGIIILGNAPINKFGGLSLLDFNLNTNLSYFGGNDKENNSGVLKYVRIEFSGRKLNTTKELNGLSLAGVGNKTIFENIQISYSNDDSFECYGGEVNFKNLISFRATDDDFDFTLGTQCDIKNSIAIRYPFSSDVAKSRCFEIDSYDKIDQFDISKPLFTKIIAENITLINNEENDQGLVREAIFIKENSFFSLKNSVISGFEKCILFEKNIKIDENTIQKVALENVLLNSSKKFIESELLGYNKDIASWYSKDTYKVECSNLSKYELFIELDVKKNPDFRLKNSKIVTIPMVSNN